MAAMAMAMARIDGLSTLFLSLKQCDVDLPTHLPNLGLR
jgi:hypothetical protein